MHYAHNNFSIGHEMQLILLAGTESAVVNRT